MGWRALSSPIRDRNKSLRKSTPISCVGGTFQTASPQTKPLVPTSFRYNQLKRPRKKYPEQYTSENHVIKLVHGILPTNSKLHRINQVRNRCPRSKALKEDWQHIVKCPSPTQVAWRTEMLKAVDNKCISLRTHPEPRELLVTTLHNWMAWDYADDGPPFFVTPQIATTNQIKRLITRQNDIGWHQLFLGRFCTDWSEVQEAYYATSHA
jgi:hypothetical protein